MITNDRIAEVLSIPDDGQRGDALRQLDHRIASRTDASLSTIEVLSGFEGLRSETSIPAQAFLWRLLINAPGQPQVRDHALKVLRQGRGPHRGFALFYLRLHYPELMLQLIAQFEHDPDPDVRYEISEYFFDKDRNKSMEMKIDLLPCESHELNDALVLEITAMGEPQHLAELRRRDQIAGGETIFGVTADALQRRLEES